MLRLENVEQLFDEHMVWQVDPKAAGQELDRVVFNIAVRRADLLNRVPWLIDGVFAAWAICIPFMPQPESYTRLMQARRVTWFQGASPSERDRLAPFFFTADLLRMELHELGNLVASENSAELIINYLGSPSGDEQWYADETEAEAEAEPAADSESEGRGEPA